MMDYKNTLKMPNTKFPMRGNLGIRELDFQKKWEDIKLYEKVLEKNKNNKPFILHDGPPYANGDIHIGHAFQKTLKDFVLRYKTMMGFYTPYIPGWDVHGLPIENEVVKKGVKRKEIERAEFLKICQEFAYEQVERQKVQFKRLGILGEWDKPYITHDNSFVAEQIRLFSKMVKRGLIYRGLKPVYWSPSSESAFAEAEIEYMDKESFSIFASFDIVENEKFKNTKLLIWTTTPWTLPGNLAVSVHPDKTYVLVDTNKGKFILIKTLVEKVMEQIKVENYQIVDEFIGSELEYIKYKHPLFDRTSPIILGDHVTDEDGTGLVHTAPGFGEDDYNVSRKYNLDILAPISGTGILTEEAYQYEGMFYEKANEAIIEDLDKLGHLLSVNKIIHSYPHDWRTHKPIIFRATPQWFFNVSSIKEDLLKEVDNINWYPSWGKIRMTNMIKDRDDWVISRQRAWGVPIPVFYDEDNNPILDEKLMLHVADIFEEKGSNYWYEAKVEDLLPKDYLNKNLTIETDIMDVWFDSGTSYSILNKNGLNFPADLYLEGSDQYRGWFNSSLITSTAVYKKSPYISCVSHGFVLDGQGRKMSKSLGNVIDPQKVIKEMGADIIRLWVSSVTYQADVRISNEMLKQVSESYRKIRNTFRFMLGNLSDFNMDKYVSFSMRGNLNQMITVRYQEVRKQILDAYENYEFDKIYRIINPFIINELSAFYLDYTKDILYIESSKDFERDSVQSTIYDILLGLLKLLTPIIPHTTSEAYDDLAIKKELDIYLENMPPNYVHVDEDLMKMYYDLNIIRHEVLKSLEVAREQKIIGKSLEASLEIYLSKDLINSLNNIHLKPYQIFMVREVKLIESNKLEVVVIKKDGKTCERCWNVFDELDENMLCKRCQKVLKEEGLDEYINS